MLWSLLLTTAAVQAAVLPYIQPNPCDDGVRNANHIFNAIHSSMRQWGSSLNHNGMSLFLAQVPAGTQFYHGSPKQEPVEGMEWLAFEPEHAINFASRMKHPPPPPPDKPGMMEMSLDESRSCKAGLEEHCRGHLTDHRFPQSPIMEGGDDRKSAPRPRPNPMEAGWLHTYRTKTLTPLLYIDGMSAGKCEKGTLDTQDVLLLNARNESQGMFWERERAERLCKMAAQTWNGKIKGFIRMEAGFEIIMCSFAKNLDFLQAVRAGSIAPDGEEPPPDDRFFGDRNIWDWVQAIAARYDGIGGGRVKLNYDRFVTSYHYDLDLFTGDDGLPRLENIPVSSLDKIRDDIHSMVNDWDPSINLYEEKAIDWQKVADMVVERYAKELKYLVSGALTEPEEFFHELVRILRVFVDSDARNTTAEVDRCVAQMIPIEYDVSCSVAGRAVHSVARTICSALFAAFDAHVPLLDTMDNLRSLIEYLDWTVWKRCPECPLGTVCFIPVWPFGTTEDHEHPQCRNASELEGRRGYWGSLRPRQMEPGLKYFP
ncbi:uncharacterized protein Z518_04732 [Rhinocladiella mackenziei CBS 650.93]|uniref:Rhinocladiella mackenziei CBS 650.93 unplaced genomic scaffold supercont1.3, whole genome shotgun sequence n=1 Tax=Rhinocladiella mackenziei CBS 650.93 TaxID=1442369 RepID=A0A0D2IUB7_9EURO|nr:uncharacterized protein Z518_04732 [Rhinocladiella mackenziei CBS 650.93]KIX06756.1 hypothetical protein Z518_04732 [Rhinocladiella mackenziei CBS 650.93]